MKLSEIKVIEKTNPLTREVFIDGIKQNNVAKVETEVLPNELTVVKISYFVDKFEFTRKEGEI